MAQDASSAAPFRAAEQQPNETPVISFESLFHDDDDDGGLGKKFNDDFPFSVDGVVRSEPGKFVFFSRIVDAVESFVDFKPRHDDVWVVTFPKSGTTWTLEMVWMLVNNCDAETAKKEQLCTRAPFLEETCIDNVTSLPDDVAQVVSSLVPTPEMMSEMASPRVIKSHLPFYLLPPSLLDTSKVIYVARNPKDVIVSYYFHHKLFPVQSFSADIESFAEYFMNDQVIYSPYFPHVLDAWKKRDNPNLLFLFYEDMKRDLKGELQKVAEFLGKRLTDEEIQMLVEHLSFEKLSENDTVNMECFRSWPGAMSPDGRFFRKGKTGDWKQHFSPEFNERLDRWIADNLKDSDLEFVTELDVAENAH